ncbi:ABC transporter substrate-binding protein [Thalassobium sp. R2A62]|uniref:ABC transporter substrate-binding protein n=1 Tax=Thalassobium sp. R2A62 TaxID=633131 RepID=UPI0001B1D4D7|nr:ABC transporter substrate-binding protein [Thalassobium sp. R2A62]EET49473.1 spermidine/putrescine ABC transporter, periplasmic spermidine/putrescine-binding protein [Thalassobium sp. R2A62]MDG1341309.1 ABC transporter substrate-binding protein [Paracoccaceae bacterium]MDG2452421.1 ABC transporter substrate-binding protein [Paracoccaceae bacterium]
MKLTKLMGSAALISLATAVSAEDPELLIFDWSGYEEADFYTKYTEENGVAPTFAFFGEEEEAFQKLRSGFRADVSHPCSQSVDKWRQAGLIEPWDLSKIPSYSTVADEYQTAPIFTDGDDVYFIPADLGATAIAYNTEEVPAEDVASLQVFHNEKYAGRLSLPDNVEDAFALAYLATGISDWTQATTDDVAAAADWLRTAHALNRAYWADGAELQQLMATGEVLVSWTWNEVPVTMVGEDFPIGFNRSPAEGSSVWFCGYVNLVDGPGSEDKAHQFMEAWLQPTTTDYIVNEWGYGHSNTQAMAGIGAETLEEVGLGEVDVPLLAQLPMDNAIRELMIQEFEKIKVGF